MKKILMILLFAFSVLTANVYKQGDRLIGNEFMCLGGALYYLVSTSDDSEVIQVSYNPSTGTPYICDIIYEVVSENNRYVDIEVILIIG